MRTYYDIGLNLFTRSFPDPERMDYRGRGSGGDLLHSYGLGSAGE